VSKFFDHLSISYSTCSQKVVPVLYNDCKRIHQFCNLCFVGDSEIKFEEAAVLHFTYTKFSDLTSRRDRCHCKPTKEDVKRCFMLEFDRAVSVLQPTSFLREITSGSKRRSDP
jgi:hypothetical protein